MSIVPCGANMGHGSSCTEGYLCDSCKRIAELQAQLKSSVEEAYNNGVRAVQDEANRSINELEAQLEGLKPYLHHTGNCTKTKSFKVNADCSCGLRDILEKDDE